MADVVREGDKGDGEPPPPAGNGSANGWRKEYWRRNLRLMVILLAIWFVVSFGCGVLFIEQLNKIEINHFPLGLWFAQQGSIYVFVILILVYALLMDRLDERFGVREDDESEGGSK